jgi:hypothetical protein
MPECPPAARVQSEKRDKGPVTTTKVFLEDLGTIRASEGLQQVAKVLHEGIGTPVLYHFQLGEKEL